MAEIPRFFAEQQLQRRSGVVRTAGAGANLPTISGAGGGVGQGTAAIGQALSRLGNQLAVQNERFERARAGVLSVEAMSQAFEEMGALEAEIVQDQSIFPTDRAGAFRERFEPRIAELKDTIPLLGQESFLRGVNNAFLRSERNLRDTGRKEAIQRGRTSAQLALQQMSQSLLTTDNEFDERQIMANMSSMMQGFVDQGIFSPQESAAILQEQLHLTAKTEMELLIQIDPRAAVEQLRGGFEENQDLNPAELPGLLQKAMGSFDSMLNREAKQEQLQTRRLRQAQDTRASEIRSNLYRSDITISELESIRTAVNDDVRENSIGEEDHSEFVKAIETRIEKIADRREDDEDDATLRDLTLQLHAASSGAELARVKRDIIDRQEALSVASMDKLMTRVQSRQDRNYFTNRPNYKEGLQIISGLAFPVGQVALFFEKMDSRIRNRLSRAFDVYRDEMERIYSIEGIERGDARAIAVARELRDQFFRVGADPNEKIPLPKSLSLEKQSFQDAVRKLNEMSISEEIKDSIYEDLEAENNRLFQKEMLEKAGEIEGAVRVPLTTRERFFGVSPNRLFPGD